MYTLRWLKNVVMEEWVFLPGGPVPKGHPAGVHKGG